MSLQNRSLWTAALIAGVAMAVFSSIPIINLLNCLLCAWLWLGGMFAVWYYRRSNPGGITTSQGAMIGAAAGIIGAVLGTILGMLLGGASLASQMAAQAESMGDAGDMVVGLLAGGLGTIIAFFFNIVFYVLFGAIGGVIGASLFGKGPSASYPGPYSGQ